MDRVKIGYMVNNRKTIPIYLTKHSWDCDWYWGFGYVGNDDMHFHMSSVVPNKSDKNVLFFEGIGEVKLLKKYDGWKLMELFAEAYNLSNCAEMYYRGGAGISCDGFIKKDEEKAKEINKELEKLLDYIWEYVKNPKGGKND